MRRADQVSHIDSEVVHPAIFFIINITSRKVVFHHLGTRVRQERVFHGIMGSLDTQSVDALQHKPERTDASTTAYIDKRLDSKLRHHVPPYCGTNPMKVNIRESCDDPSKQIHGQTNVQTQMKHGVEFQMHYLLAHLPNVACRLFHHICYDLVLPRLVLE